MFQSITRPLARAWERTDSPGDDSLVYRWGRILTTIVLFLDLTLGLWRFVLQMGLLLALVVVIEPAWAIALGGGLIIACEEVALMAFRE